MAEEFVSGTWSVREGENAEFEKRWLAFTQWSLDTMDGAIDFVLMHQKDEPKQYISMGVWRDTASLDAWRSHPTFAELRGKIVEVCEHFHGTDYNLAARPKAPVTSA